MFTALKPLSEYDAPAPFRMPSYASVMGDFHKVQPILGRVRLLLATSVLAAVPRCGLYRLASREEPFFDLKKNSPPSRMLTRISRHCRTPRPTRPRPRLPSCKCLDRRQRVVYITIDLD